MTGKHSQPRAGLAQPQHARARSGKKGSDGAPVLGDQAVLVRALHVGERLGEGEASEGDWGWATDWEEDKVVCQWGMAPNFMPIHAHFE